jgi:hypothetical protein
VYPLKSRDEIGSAFGSFKLFVEKQTGETIRCVRTDNAKEYIGGEFCKLVREHGIKHETSVARCPQQNGISERMNRTLMEMTRCMLDESGLPDSVWVEALQTANYIRNRCVSRAIPGMCPFEVFWGVKPTVSNNNRRIFVSRNVRFLEDDSDEDATLEEEDEEEAAGPSTRSTPTRVNPPRLCKQSRSVYKRKQSPQSEPEEKKHHYSPDRGEQLTAPTFQIGGPVEIKTPKSFQEATEGEFQAPW